MFRADSLPPVKPSSAVLGLNINADRILLVYGNLSGLVNERLSFSAPLNENFPTTLALLSRQADRLLALTNAQRLPLPDRVSVAVAGNYDKSTGILESSPFFTEWHSVSLRSQLNLAFNLPIVIEQSANAGALAENFFGAGHDVANLVFVSLNPEVRIGMLNNDVLYRIPGGKAGNIGELKLDGNGLAEKEKTARLNDFASPRGLVKLALTRFPNHWQEALDVYQIIDAANAGDPYALEVIHEAGHYLGLGLVSTVYILRPQLIVLGHPGCLLGELLTDPIRETLGQVTGLALHELPEIVSSQLCNRLPELEALSPAIYASRSQMTS